MSLEGFLRTGHTPTLVAALLYFDVSFMAWVRLGPLAPFLREELGLTARETGRRAGMLVLLELGARWTAHSAPGAREQAGAYSYGAVLRTPSNLSQELAD